MHTESISNWQHTHIFGQDQIRSGERRTQIVIIITGLMMVVEIAAGIIFGSMALTADGIHMGSHMVGLGITYFAYIYARRHAHDLRYSFGTGKVNAMAGYTSAMVLIFIAIFMAYESVMRLVHPVAIHYNQAILVAVIGLAVNGFSMLILGDKGHTHTHGEDEPDTHIQSEHDHENEPEHSYPHGHHAAGVDHNLRAAYIHVLTDAMTSVLAIFALLVAKYLKVVWMDPVMGIVGALLVVRWSIGLIQGTTKVLLDHQVPEQIRKMIISILEGYKDTKVSDLHIWSIGPGIYSSEVTLVTSFPESPHFYKALIPQDAGVVHTTVEIHQCPDS